MPPTRSWVQLAIQDYHRYRIEECWTILPQLVHLPHLLLLFLPLPCELVPIIIIIIIIILEKYN